MPPRVLASGPKPCGGNNLKFRHFSHLKFTLREFSFVTKRIHHCIISFNGDCKESDNRRNSSNPRDIGVCQKLAQDSTSQAVWMIGERELEKHTWSHKHR